MSGFMDIEMVLAQLLIIAIGFVSTSSYTPHIIIITVDDVGYNDFGFIHSGKGDARTPYIDKYAEVSMKLDNYYVMPNGHSSRSALLTGIHPAQLGTQFEMEDATVPYGLGTEHNILPQYLKDLNYKSHAVGQWDLGFYSKDLLPTSRGYDTFYGSYLSYGNYVTHRAKDQNGHEGLDLHDNMDLDTSREKTFKTELYGSKAVDIINNHDDKDPLHLYVAFQAAQIDDLGQCKDSERRKEIPIEYYREFDHVQDPTRKCYLALLKAVDQQYGRIMKALKDNLLLLNSVVIFTTTSGGPAAGADDFNAASNSPFRGSKLTGWEGGVKGVATIFTDQAGGSGRSSACKFHITDWIPTLASLYRATTGSSTTLKLKSELYGTDQFNCVFRDGRRARETIMHFVYGNSASYTKFDYKLVTNADGHMGDMNEWYSQSESSINCGNPGLRCVPSEAPCLFNIRGDPCEMRNIAAFIGSDHYLNNMLDDIRKFNMTVKYTSTVEPDESGNPANNDLNAWQPWVDSSAGTVTPTMSVAISLITILHAQLMWS